MDVNLVAKTIHVLSTVFFSNHRSCVSITSLLLVNRIKNDALCTLMYKYKPVQLGHLGPCGKYLDIFRVHRIGQFISPGQFRVLWVIPIIEVVQVFLGSFTHFARF